MINATQEEYIVATELWEQWHLHWCWTSVTMAVSVYNKLRSKTAKFSAVKENILFCYLDLGWDDSHQPWLKDGVPFTHNSF